MSADQVDDTPQPAAIPLRFIDAAGNAHDVVAQPGDSLMAVATQHLIEGIGGDCGGCCACGTCRIYVPAEWQGCFAEPAQSEQDMIDFSQDATVGVRLACQTKVSDEMDGMVLHLPESQHY